MPPRSTPDPDLKSMPPGVPYIIGNEAAERFSFYGMKGILTVFMTKHLLDASGNPDVMTDEEAKGSTTSSPPARTSSPSSAHSSRM